MAPPSATREEAERTLAGLDTAQQQLAAAMYALDSHPAVRFLRGGMLRGATQQRWDALHERITVLWAHFSAAGDLIGAAREVAARHSRRADDLVELNALLHEPVIAFDADGLPADGTGKPVARRIGLDRLLPKLTADSAALLAELSTVDTVVGAVAGALTPLTEAVEAVRAHAGDLADDRLAGAPAALGTALDELRADLLSDPLAAAPDGTLTGALAARLDRLTAEAATARSRLADLDTLRADYTGRRDRLAELLSAVDDAQDAARTAYQTVAEKIADPGLPPVPDADTGLRSRFDELDALHKVAAWGQLGAAFTAVERHATRARDRADALRAAADGLMARRDELRGRLDAYRAKAARLSALEDDTVAARYTDAAHLLYTAPCDLPAATRAVFAYQQALAELATPRESSA